MLISKFSFTAHLFFANVLSEKDRYDLEKKGESGNLINLSSYASAIFFSIFFFIESQKIFYIMVDNSIFEGETRSGLKNNLNIFY